MKEKGVSVGDSPEEFTSFYLGQLVGPDDKDITKEVMEELAGLLSEDDMEGVWELIKRVEQAGNLPKIGRASCRERV